MSANHISFPENFMARDCDRLLVMRLQKLGKDSTQAFYFMWKMWVDFCLAGKGYRVIDGDDLKSSDIGCIIETACGWRANAEEANGVLLELALDAGFLSKHTMGSGEEVLVCNGVFPLNDHLLEGRVGKQSKGAYLAAVRKTSSKVQTDLDSSMDLFAPVMDDCDEVPEASRKATLSFVMQISRVLGLAEVTPESVKGSRLFTAYECLMDSTKAEREAVLAYLLSMRGSPQIPQREDLVLKEFKTHLEAAHEKFGK